MEGLFDGINILESEYEMPNGKKLKIVALDIFQRLDIQKKIQAMKSDAEKSKLFKEIAQLAVVNDDYEPYLTKADLNKLALANNGEIVFEIFNEVMKLSGATSSDAEEAKKK